MGERESVEDSDGSRSIRNFFSKQRRVIIFGDAGVGKTALLNNLMGLPDCCDTVATNGVNTTFCEVTSECSTWSQKQQFGTLKTYETCLPPPTVIDQCSRLIAKDFLKDSLDFYTSACVIPFYLWIGLMNFGIGALFLAVLFTFQLFVFILRRKHSFQSIPRIADATLFLTFVNILLSSKGAEVNDVVKLDRLFVPRLIFLTIICIAVAQFQCRFGITLALSFFQFSQTHHAHSEFTDVSCYKSGLRFITSIICICMFMFIIRWKTFNLKISTAIVATCLVLLTLISYFELLAYPSVFFMASISVTFTTILTIQIARFCGAKSYSEVSAIRPKFQCIGIVIGVITAYVFGLENIVPRCCHSCVEISFNVAMVIVYYCSTDWSFNDRHPATVMSNKVERTIDSFQLTVFEFSNKVQFGNLFHDFITQGDVYILVFTLNRDVQLEKQCHILLKRLRAFKIKGQKCRQKSLLLVGTHKVEVTQCYMDSLSKLLREQIDSSDWDIMAGRNVEQILYAVDNTDMQSAQFDDIRRGIWARLISQEHKENVSMTYINVHGESVHLCEGKVSILQANGRQFSLEVDIDDLLNTIVCLFTDTYVSESEDVGAWVVGKDRLQSICDLAPNLLKALQDIDLMVYKPTDEFYLVPSLLPAYSGDTNDIWCRADGDAEFYLAFGHVFHRAVLHLLVLYFVEMMNIPLKKPVIFSNVALLCVEEINFLLEMITFPDKDQNFIRISIRDSSKNPLYLNILDLILKRVELICRNIFPGLDYICGIACPKAKRHNFHLLSIASRNEQLSSDTDSVIRHECCDRIHRWLPKRNKLTTCLDASKLTFRQWPQAVVTLVCHALNKYSATGNNWLGLVGKLKFTVEFVETIEDEKDRTLAVLHHWVSTSLTPPTLSDLIDLLKSMERRDIVADINSYLDSDNE